MKKLFTFLFVLLPMLASAQGFVKDGKVWNIDVYSPLNFEYAYSQAYIIDGDTIVGGRQAKKCYHQQRDNQEPEYMMAVYEESGKVLFAIKGTDDWNLAYDFSLEAGDETVVESIEGYGKYIVTVHSTETREIKGTVRKVLVVNTSSAEEDCSEPAVWVEGIGCTFGPQKNCGVGLPTGLTEYRFTTCTEDGLLIYDLNDTMILSELIVTKIEKAELSGVKESEIIYDLQGRRYKTFPHPGIFIKDGQKIIK